MEFLETFSFTCKHKDGKENVVAYAHLRRYTILSILTAKILGFYTNYDLYKEDEDF